MINIKVIGTPLYQWESGRKIQITPLPNMRVDAVHFSNFGDTEALVVKPREENGNIIADIPNILLQSGANLVVYTVNVSQDSVETLVDCTISVRSRAKPADYVYKETEVLTITTAVEKALLEAKESGEFDGKDGADGKDGVSVSHKWNGTTLEITSANGTSSADLKGEKGNTGEKGDKGDKGEVDYSLVANALKGTASGSAVSMKDVSPLEHNIGVKLASKNIVDIKQMLNECLVDNGDGTFTYTRKASMVSASFPLKLKAGTKITSKAEIISSQNNTENSLCYSVTYADGATKGYYLSDSKVTLEKDIVDILIYSYEPNVSFVFKEWQLELGDTATAYTPFADVSSVTLKKCGKNLLLYPYSNTTKTASGITYTDNGDGSISIDGTPTAGSEFVFSGELPLTAGTYTFSLCLDTTDVVVASVQFRSRATGEWVKNVAQIEGKKLSVTFTLSEEELKENMVKVSLNAGYYQVEKHLLLYPQIELGTTATEYEPYKEPIPYTPNADGTVDGVTSLYPTTTLIADSGVTITAEYNKDTNKVIENLVNAIISLGGNV